MPGLDNVHLQMTIGSWRGALAAENICSTNNPNFAAGERQLLPNAGSGEPIYPNWPTLPVPGSVGDSSPLFPPMCAIDGGIIRLISVRQSLHHDKS